MTQGTKTTSATSSDSEDLQMAKGEEAKKLADLKRIATKGDGVILTKPLHIIRNSRFKLLVFMVVMYITVMYADLFKDPTDSLVSNIRMALFAGNLVIIFMGVQFLPEPSKKRPFPLFWRIAQAAAFAYALNILMWLCFSRENLQFILGRIYDNKLGKPLPEKSYADDCRVYTPENPISSFYNITSAIDVFVAAHFLGWTFKIWIFRNSTMAWFLSIMFEIMEWTMEVWLPNFKECWWDHFLFDMFGCNFIGMLIGIWTIRKFKMRKLYWFMEPTEKSSSLPWYKKITYIFTSRDEYVKADKWHWLSEMWTFNAVVWFWFINLYLDLSYFYNKAMIDIPPPHWLCALRIWVLAFFAIIASNDYYDYVISRKCSSMTLPIFLLHMIMILEGLLFLKNLKEGLFSNPLHYHIKLFWIAFFVVIAAFQVFFVLDKIKQRRKYLAPKKLK